MEQPPPRSPEEASELAGKEYAQLGQPQVVKIFGILHVVFAGFGLLSTAWGLYVAIAGNPMTGFGTRTPAMRAQAEAEAAMQERLLPSTYVSTALTLAITALMLIAFIFPAMKEMTDQMGKGSPMPAGAIGAIMLGSMVFGVLISCVYPILTLVLLNRPNVKTWFANQPD